MLTPNSTMTHSSRSVPEEPETLLERCSLRLVDVALFGAVFAVPCCLGGRIALGHCVLAACAVLAALAWSVSLLVARRPTWTITWVEPLLLGVLGLVLLQITPLPAELLHLVSPRHQALLPLWSANAGSTSTLGLWSTLSLNVGESREALVIALSYVLLFYIAAQRIQRLEDIERLLKWIAGAAAGMALFGVVQWLSNNGKFFWFYDYPLTNSGHRLKGAFTNRNHFAQFLVLGCGPLVWWILRVLEDRSRESTRFGEPSSARGNQDTVLATLLLFLGVLIFAVVFSLSRGGMLALGVSLSVMLGALALTGDLSGRVAVALLGTTVISSSLFLMFGFEKVAERLDHWQSDLRLAIWQANVRIVGDFPLFGTGVGSHVEAYRMYFDPPFHETEFTHAESSYLQVASETGLAGLSLALLCGAFCGVWCWRVLRSNADRRARVLAAAIMASLAANALHALVDFVWYVPGLMTVLLLLAASARRLDQLSSRKPSLAKTAGHEPHGNSARGTIHEVSTRTVPRWLGLAVGGLTLCGAWCSVSPLTQSLRAEPYWFDYLKLTLRPNAQDATAATTDASLDQATEADAEAQQERQRFKQRVTALNQTLKWNPSHSRAHARLATAYLRAFEHLQEQSENPLTLSQLRDAALASQFPSVEELRAWLQRAVGANFKYLDAAAGHARHAVQLCPLQGLAYVHLAELRFLESLHPDESRPYLEQAKLVRPHNAQVQFVVGREALLEGRLDEALSQWKAAFHQDRSSQNQILNLLVGTAPARLILENLEPDLEALERLESRYRNLPPAEYTAVARAYADALKSELSLPECDRPVERMLSAAGVYARLNDRTNAEACFRRAIEADGSAYAARYAYGVFLYQQQDFAAASEHLNWCLRIKPQDASLRHMAENALSNGLKSDRTIIPAEYRRKRR